MNMTGMISASRITATALARPGWPKLNSSLYMRSAMMSVSKLPPVITYTMSKALSAVMIMVVETTATVGRSSGNVMPRNTCHSLAPSTRAASRSSALMPFSAADRMTMQNPVQTHAATTMSQIVLSGASWRKVTG